MVERCYILETPAGKMTREWVRALPAPAEDLHWAHMVLQNCP